MSRSSVVHRGEKVHGRPIDRICLCSAGSLKRFAGNGEPLYLFVLRNSGRKVTAKAPNLTLTLFLELL
ncbi:hypothetical protein MPL3365_100092 [Mesorhizobium plurifarium]|uniref:Uncharacterized protein n=1 Tax=Mesorhizobium plurifarium TaxID=69974 RepID=A0A090G0U0_MESPL|nr:hypothetical protein MPL3365_100092 [Mesorhizobium plurifarium]